MTLEPTLQGTSYRNFINAIKSSATRRGYIISLKRYLNYLKMTEVNDLLLEQNPKVIESQIIDYIMSLREDGIAYKTIQFLTAPIFTFYQLNDIMLNRKKISRYLGEYKKIVKDKAYNVEQIQQALTNADQRKDVDPFA